MVGRLVRVLEDSTRIGPFDKTHKKVILSVFYPTDPNFTPSKKAYYKDLYSPKEDVFIKVMESIGAKADDIEKLEINTYNNAPMNQNLKPLPVIIYSPGFGMDRDMFISVIEDLVMSSYIVITVGHIFDSLFTVFPSGEVAYQKEEVNQTSDEDIVLLNKEMEKLLTIRSLDIGFVLTQLNTLNQDLHYKMDLSKIGVMGHSLGGGAVLKQAFESPKIKAGIMFDGSIHLLPLKEKYEGKDYLKTPFLLFRQHNSTYELMVQNSPLKPGQKEILSSLISNNQIYLSKVLKKYTSFLKLDLSKHNTYTDLPLFLKGVKMVHDGLSIEETHRLISQVCIHFFNEFLKNKKKEYRKFIAHHNIKSLHIINASGDIIK